MAISMVFIIAPITELCFMSSDVRMLCHLHDDVSGVIVYMLLFALLSLVDITSGYALGPLK